MPKAELFWDGKGQAVRLPKEYTFERQEVLIRKSGDTIMLFPNEAAVWKTFHESFDAFTPDFLEDREQGEHREREALFD